MNDNLSVRFHIGFLYKDQEYKDSDENQETLLVKCVENLICSVSIEIYTV